MAHKTEPILINFRIIKITIVYGLESFLDIILKVNAIALLLFFLHAERLFNKVHEFIMKVKLLKHYE